MIGQSRQVAARPGLNPHRHQLYEFCLIERREVHWFIDAAPVVVPPGSLFFTRPGQLHGHRRGIVEPCDLRWVQFDPAGGKDISILLGRIDASPSAVWPGDPRLNELHEAMLDECRRVSPDSASMLSALILMFLNIAIRTQRQRIKGSPHPAIARAMALIDSDIEHAWSLDEMQEASGVSRTRLLQLFRQEMGVSPVAYATRVRLRQAERQLRETQRPITDIAIGLGFASSQHFATAFRQQFGMTPSAYRAAPQM